MQFVWVKKYDSRIKKKLKKLSPTWEKGKNQLKIATLAEAPRNFQAKTVENHRHKRFSKVGRELMASSALYHIHDI